MKSTILCLTFFLLATINSFSQNTFKKAASTEAKTPVMNVGDMKKEPLIQKQTETNRTLLVPMDTANAQMTNAIVDIGYNSAYGVYDVFGRYHLQIFLLNENNIEIARWSFNENKPNVTNPSNTANDGYAHVQLQMEIENSKAASSFGSLKKGATLKFVFDCAFQNIEGGGENYFYINTFSATFKFRNPWFSTSMWPGNDAEQKYTAGHKSSVFSFLL